MSFVNIDLTTDATTLEDQGVDSMATSFAAQGLTGWQINDASLEAILLGALAQIAANIANGATELPPAVFRAFGTRLANLPYEQGAYATVISTWTISDTAVDHTIPAGTSVSIADQGFAVLADTDVPIGTTSVNATLVASDVGTAFNGFSSPVALVNEIDWVSDVALVGSTSGGVDPEDDASYQGRLVGELALQAPRPITANDYAAFTLSVPSSIVPAGVVIGRSTAIDGYNPSGASFTANTTSGSVSLASVSDFTNLAVGNVASGPGIREGSIVTAVNTGARTATLSLPATATATAARLHADTYQNARCVTVFVTDPQGNALPDDTMTALATWLATYREINFQVFVQPPTYNQIYITYRAQALPGYDRDGLAASINAALEQYLSPEIWGNPAFLGQTGQGAGPWLNRAQGFDEVRYNSIIGVIEGVAGVQYVYAGSAGLTIGTSATPTGTADIALGGPAPLPSIATDGSGNVIGIVGTVVPA